MVDSVRVSRGEVGNQRAIVDCDDDDTRTPGQLAVDKVDHGDVVVDETGRHLLSILVVADGANVSTSARRQHHNPLSYVNSFLRRAAGAKRGFGRRSHFGKQGRVFMLSQHRRMKPLRTSVHSTEVSLSSCSPLLTLIQTYGRDYKVKNPAVCKKPF